MSNSYGTAGGSLNDTSFAKNAGTARAGQIGERLSAERLDRLAQRHGFTVLHDLRIPGTKANIDHIVVAGREVTVIDSKYWQGGFYWTYGGRTRRGLEQVPFADKRGLPLVHRRLDEYLAQQNVRYTLARPVLIIHPASGHKPPTLWAYRPASNDGAPVRVVRPERLRFVARSADPQVVAALRPLIIGADA